MPLICNTFLQAMGLMNSGMCDSAIAGGVDFMSDVPIRFSRAMRAKMLAMNKVRSLEFLEHFPFYTGFSEECRDFAFSHYAEQNKSALF